MRADAAELYGRWWPVALRFASRWAQTDADAEDIAAAAIIAFIEEAPAGLSDRAIERALSRSISRSREAVRRSGRSGYLSAAEPEEDTDADAATWERVHRALDIADLSLFDRAVQGNTTGLTGGTTTRSALASRRSRARKRAAAAAVAVDEPGAGPTCARFVAVIPEVARRTATSEQRSTLLQHTLGCDFCDRMLADRRSVAHRWKIAGALPGLGVFRKWGWRWWGTGATHPGIATGAVVAAGAVVLASVLVPTLVVPDGSTTAAVTRVATTTTMPPPVSTTSTSTTTTPPPPSTTTTAPPPVSTTTSPAAATTVATVKWGVRAQAVAQPEEQGVVPVAMLAAATRDGAADTGDTLTFSSGCGTVQATTGSTGTASARVTCPPSSFPLVVTVSDGAGVSTEVDVDEG